MNLQKHHNIGCLLIADTCDKNFDKGFFIRDLLFALQHIIFHFGEHIIPSEFGFDNNLYPAILIVSTKTLNFHPSLGPSLST